MNISRYRRGAIAREMSETERAYCAGIIDGEGSIIASVRGYRSVAVKVSVTNTKLVLLQYLKQITGIGGVNQQHKRSEKRAATWFWTVHAETVLKQVRPYLIIKDEQADAALAIRRMLSERGRAAFEDAKDLLMWIRHLNRRGGDADDDYDECAAMYEAEAEARRA